MSKIQDDYETEDAYKTEDNYETEDSYKNEDSYKTVDYHAKEDDPYVYLAENSGHKGGLFIVLLALILLVAGFFTIHTLRKNRQEASGLNAVETGDETGNTGDNLAESSASTEDTGIGNAMDQAEKEAPIPFAQSLEEVASYVDQLESEKYSATVTLYLDQATLDSLADLNEELNAAFYLCSNHSEKDADAEGRIATEFSINCSDEYFVYHHRMDGWQIPAERSMASELNKAIDAVLKECITAGMGDYDKELALHDYLTENCEYSETGVQMEHTAYGALVNKKAQCDGYAKSMYLLLSSQEIPVKMVAGTTADGQTSHAWNQIQLDDVWYNLDVTWDDPLGAQKPNHMYMNVSDDIMKIGHVWDDSRTFACDTNDENYYMKNGIFFTDKQSMFDYIQSEVTANGWADCVGYGLYLNHDELNALFGAGHSHIIAGDGGYQCVQYQ